MSVELRPEVAACAVAMEQKLQKKAADGKRGWKKCEPEALLEDLFEHAQKLRTSVLVGNWQKAARDAVDICIYGLFFWWLCTRKAEAEPSLRTEEDDEA